MLLSPFFSFEPTPSQHKLFKVFERFARTDTQRATVLIQGYAGTGKTTSIAAIVAYYRSIGRPSFLMAPTGRAAKVMEKFSYQSAYTIHSIIYRFYTDPETGLLEGRLRENRMKNTCYIVDEVSMIASTRSITGNDLLADLLSFIFSGKGNRLILVGDNAQLPPVGQNLSRALELDYLSSQCNLKVASVVLKDVVRQASESGILFNATHMRTLIPFKESNPTIGKSVKTKGFKDIFKITSDRLEEGLRYAYENDEIRNTILICRANWIAARYNQYIRHQILYFDSEVDAGDQLMIVKNNYFYQLDQSQGNFLANGDLVEVRKMISEEKMHGFRFATLELQLLDKQNTQPFEAKVLLDCLHNTHSSLPFEELKRLKDSVELDYQEEEDERKREEMMILDPYLNALQVKYAYALTAHKSQGGQWDTVFLDPGPLREEEPDTSYIRWLYTAMTRASKKLFLINFNQNFPVEDKKI